MSTAESAGAPPADPAELLELALELARRAGALLVEASGTVSRRSALAESADRKSSRTDLATAADLASERLVVEGIAAERPEDAVLGEEGGERAGTSGLTWVVDPLDGTTNFVYGFPAWSVSIAVADAEGSLVGVVHDPLREETFAAIRSRGATLNGEPLEPHPVPPLAEALVGTGFGYAPARRRAQARLLPVVLESVRDLRRGGSAALDLCYVAAGRLDAFYEGGLKPWDRAAGALVACETGAVAVDLEGLLEVPTLVVATPPLLDELLALLSKAAAPD